MNQRNVASALSLATPDQLLKSSWSFIPSQMLIHWLISPESILLSSSCMVICSKLHSIFISQVLSRRCQMALGQKNSCCREDALCGQHFSFSIKLATTLNKVIMWCVMIISNISHEGYKWLPRFSFKGLQINCFWIHCNILNIEIRLTEQ